MPMNLISKYFIYKKNLLISYGLAVFSDLEYRCFIIECLDRYFSNYINAFYYHNFETVDNVEKFDRQVLELELEGIRLELLDSLSVREIVETNEGYLEKQKLISITLEISKEIIQFNQKVIHEEQVVSECHNIIQKLNKIIAINKNLSQVWLKIFKGNEKVHKKLLASKDTFSLRKTAFLDHVLEITLVPNIKQLNKYKKNLVEKVYREEKVVFEQVKLLCMIYNQLILKKLISHEDIFEYLIYIPESIWNKKQEIYEIFELLNDSILKSHVVLGINYSVLINSKTYQEKISSGYRFACYQDFTYINDIPAKVAAIDNSKLFSYLVVVGYKAKDYEQLKKIEAVNMKAILFSKDG